MYKCLVTGGAGFIGSNLINKLIDLGHSVINIDNESSNNVLVWNDKSLNFKLDITNYDQTRSLYEGIDYVFHMAAKVNVQQSIDMPNVTFENNIIGTATVLQCAKEANVKRVVLSSTSGIYGNSDICNVEEQLEDPLNPYSVSKLSAEKIAKMYYELYGLETISLRYFNVYGQGQPENGQYAPVIGIFFKQKRNNEPLTINGDGYQSRDFVHVSDVVDANIRSAFLDIDKDYIGQVYNVGSGVSLTINDISNLISTNKVYVDPKIGECKNSLANIDKIYKIFGWKPTIELKQWIKENI